MMNHENPPFPPSLRGVPFSENSELWVRPNRNLDWMSIGNYALTINGYVLAEQKGFDLPKFANLKHEEFLRTKEWQGSFEDLRYCLFFEQRRERLLDGGASTTDDLVFLTLNQAICDAWDRELGELDSSARYGRELNTAVVAAQSAGAIARDYFNRGLATQADDKAEQRVLEILKNVFPAYGYRGEELGLVNEASDHEKHCWVVDPQDGTSAAKAGFRGAAVSIALLRLGRPILGVVYAYSAPDNAGDLFFWAHGMQAVHRNNERTFRQWPSQPSANCTALISQNADLSAEANSRLLHPLRYRTVPGIAYRMALVAAGEGDLAVSLNAPTGWDIAGGHALLLGAGADVFNEKGQAVQYDTTGRPGTSLSYCFGGTREMVDPSIGANWQKVFQADPKPAKNNFCHLVPGNLIPDFGILSRAQGCLLGQLAGDALGSLVEFESPEQINAQFAEGPSYLSDGGAWSTIAGQPTDDSELALALARSIVSIGDYDLDRVAVEYASWMASGPFDSGITTRAALGPAIAAMKANARVAQAAMTAANPESQANGALMRISPLGIFGASFEPNTLMSLARGDARLTHPHQVCQDVNAIFAAALAFAIQTGASATQTYNYALELATHIDVAESVIKRLRSASTQPPPELFTTKQGWVLVAFQNAFFRLLNSPSMSQGIIDTVRAGGDTDTNAAIAGALLGSVHGRERVPKQWVGRLLSCRPIHGLTGVKRPRPACYWPVDALALAERLLICGEASPRKGKS